MHVYKLVGLLALFPLGYGQEIITRDVCILGGGATGSYAAVQLLERGQSVVMVEKENQLGGHSDTLYLPDGQAINYGILAYFNEKVVKDYFTLLNVEHELYTPALQLDYVNFKTGERVPDPMDVLGMVAALYRYRAAIKEFDYFRDGRYDLPDEIPEVLLRPFRELVEEHNLQDALLVFYIYAYGLGNLLEAPLLYVIQLFGIPHIEAWLHGPFIRPKNGTDTIFQKAADRIGEQNILYQSTVIQASRSSNRGTLTVKTANGLKLIHAKKLLITFPPLLSNLHGFDVDRNEFSLFGKWIYGSLYVGVVDNTGIPDGLNIFNVDPSQPEGIPVTPFEWTLFHTGVPGYYTTATVGNETMSEQDANQFVIDNIRRMGEAGTFPIDDPEIVASEAHTPSVMMAPVDEVRDGFYKKLYALQGQRSTYWTGYTFCTDYSPQLWEYTLGVLDRMA